MSIIRITKEFSFEAAHALDNYEGKCKDIHGHSYKLKITVKGKVNEDKNSPACGMVMDFGTLKAIVKDHVFGLFDHRLILRADSRFAGIEKNNDRVRYVPYQPTCENMVLEIAGILRNHLPENIELQHILLRETGTSYCEWHEGDN